MSGLVGEADVLAVWLESPRDHIFEAVAAIEAVFELGKVGRRAGQRLGPGRACKLV